MTEELPQWFPNTMEELYRLEPGEPSSINHPRVLESHGGGACPEQHWGVLDDGRVFYYRFRHSWATLALAPDWYDSSDLPARDLRTTMQAWDEAYYRGDDPLPRLWLGPRGEHQVYDESENAGQFATDDDRTDAFDRCLAQVDKEPFDTEGWELLRNDRS